MFHGSQLRRASFQNLHELTGKLQSGCVVVFQIGTLRLWTTVSCDGWECVTQQKYQ